MSDISRHRMLRAFLVSVMVIAVLPASVWSQMPASGRLFDNVDAVVVGEVISGRQAGKSASCVLLVNRKIKGSLLPNDRANIALRFMFSSEQDLTGNYGMWFLKQSAPGSWDVWSVERGMPYLRLPKTSTPEGIVVPYGLPALTRPATIGDQIAAELVAALQGNKNPSDIRPVASNFLGLEKSAFVTSLYRVLRASQDLELRFLGLAGMLKLNDLSALTDIANSMDQIPKLQVKVFVLSPIAARRESTPEVIQILGRFASSPDLDIQFEAATALRGIHTRDTLPYLVQLLDSPRQYTRQLAMLGLSRFVDNLPIETAQNVPNGRSAIPQGPAPYRTSETNRHRVGGVPLDKATEPEYIQFWKSWWAKVKGELTKP